MWNLFNVKIYFFDVDFLIKIRKSVNVINNKY